MAEYKLAILNWFRCETFQVLINSRFKVCLRHEKTGIWTGPKLLERNCKCHLGIIFQLTTYICFTFRIKLTQDKCHVPSAKCQNASTCWLWLSMIMTNAHCFYSHCIVVVQTTQLESKPAGFLINKFKKLMYDTPTFQETSHIISMQINHKFWENH